jgi:hypothetical protein
LALGDSFVQDRSYAYADFRREQSAGGGWHDFACGFTFRECYREKESSFGFGRDEGGSLAGNESAIVLSSIFSRFPCSSPGSTIRSSGSLRCILTMFEVRFLREAFLSFMINENSVCSGLFRRWRSREPSHPKQRSVRSHRANMICPEKMGNHELPPSSSSI